MCDDVIRYALEQSNFHLSPMRQLCRCKALNVFFLYDSIIVRPLKGFSLIFSNFTHQFCDIGGKKIYFSHIKEKIGGKKN